jgi:hypothetical protein
MLAGDLTPDNDMQTSIFQGCTFIDFFNKTDGGLSASPTGTWARG